MFLTAGYGSAETTVCSGYWEVTQGLDWLQYTLGI